MKGNNRPSLQHPPSRSNSQCKDGIRGGYRANCRSCLSEVFVHNMSMHVHTRKSNGYKDNASLEQLLRDSSRNEECKKMVAAFLLLL